MNRISVLVVSVVMCINTLAMAYSGGDGTAAKPYQIANKADLLELAGKTADYGNCFILTDNIDLAGETYSKALIAPDTSSNSGFQGTKFTGTFDGNDYVISNLTITTTTGSYTGLFGCVGSGGQVKILGLENIIVRGKDYVGGLVGYDYKGTITGCYSTGSVSGSYYVGGLAGVNGGAITNCYSTGSVIGSSDVGGLVGWNEYGFITNCYSTGSVSGNSDIGGLVGKYYSGTVTACFWDIQTSGQTASAGGFGKTTLEMKDMLLYSINNWGSDWTIDSGNDYPHLAWENAGGIVIAAPVVTMEGSGTADDPWIIASKEDFLLIRNAAFFWNKHYRLETDIDLSGGTYPSGLIGYDYYNRFTGSFDGKGHKIFNLTITAQKTYAGLFGYVGSGGQVKNLGLENMHVSGSGEYVGGLAGVNGGAITNCYSTDSVIGSSHVGGLVGVNEGTISNCYSTASVSGYRYVGGLVGKNYSGTITNCYSTGSVIGSSHVGGLVGNFFRGTITNCYSSGNVSSPSSAGGLVGENYYGTITNCYSSGNVNGSSFGGGLAGINGGAITNCYSTGSVIGSSHVGGLVGSNSGTVTTCFWDIQTSGRATSAGGLGKTTLEMKDMLLYSINNWGNDWTIDSGNDYPHLSWENVRGTMIGAPVVTMAGSGTMDTPWIIASKADFLQVCSGVFFWDKHYRLDTDVDLSGVTYPTSLMGCDSNYGFTGSFDGNSHKIVNLTITAQKEYAGLFGYVGSGGQVKNLGLENISVTGYYYVGGLVGYNLGSITGCYSTGSVSGSSYNVGGLVGENYSGTITNCYSTCSVSVSGSSIYSYPRVGGLVGYNSGTITGCYSTGSASSSSTFHSFVGGLVGCNNSGTITGCYSTSRVSNSSTSSNSSVGGLVGYNNSGTFTNCYSTGRVSGLYLIGGLCGCLCGTSAKLQNCFWDTITSSLTVGYTMDSTYPGTVINVVVMTTDQMQTHSPFTSAGWDFLDETVNGTSDTWRMCAEGIDYPHLSWEQTGKGDFACPDGVGVEDLQRLSSDWLSTYSAGLYGADATGDKRVDMADLAVLAKHWLEGTEEN